MNSTPDDDLLRDALADENLERLRQATLVDGLRTLRRRRRTRLALAGAASAALMFAVAVISSRRIAPQSDAVAPGRSADAAPGRTHVQIIDDDQLVALFP